MNSPSDSYSLFCFENVKNMDSENGSGIFPLLEKLTINLGITNVYKSCECLETFEQGLETLLYEDKKINDYEVIYMIFYGQHNKILIDGYVYSFEEIAEYFQGKLNGKILHFANTMQLDLDLETAQYFLDITGAKAISGYHKRAPFLSTTLDYHFFEIYQETNDIIELTEIILDKHYTLSQAMGFRIYY